MILKELKLRQAINKAFLKVKPNRTDIENFKAHLITLLDRINDRETEEFHKNLVSDFLKKTYYDPAHFINTSGRNDLVIHNGADAGTPIGVIIEAKKPANRAEMITRDNLNKKAFHELVLYYLRERISRNNLTIRHLIATNINEWFIFDATAFDRIFAQDKELVKLFNEFESGRLADTKTDFFYKQIAEPFVAQAGAEIEFTYFNLQDYREPLRNADKADDTALIALYKLLSPEHLLKLPFANDSNSLDKRFYSELLHIIGLTEVKDGGKKLIERNKSGERHAGSLLESAIIQLDSLDKLSRLDKPSQFGNTQEERLFNVALELSITWINRILFLKLLEAQLMRYHKGDKAFAFLSHDKIKGYDDLNTLFFQVLARRQQERNDNVKKAFDKVPYLNSSLFEPTEIEHSTLFISNLSDSLTIPVFSQTVLKDPQGKKRTSELNTLQYLFEFLNAYDFGAEGSEEIQEDNKTLINASVLGLIFEKINGYKDGSFFTPGFITMYMCRQTIRRAIVQKFNEAKGWHCQSIEDLYEKITDRAEANQIVNSIKICDPAVGSGHFLVSALNEMIAVKSDLKILQDREGKRLKEYSATVENDELVITDEDGKLFAYNPNGRESQRVQETIFHEKQTIIENCLFGVDINPNSVKICRLRLWIELLKNAYYKQDPKGFGNPSGLRTLETLPNIDINIKCGNSLVSRFALDADVKQALKRSKWTIDSYRNAVATYRSATNKEQKREMERLIADIKGDFRSEIAKNDPKLARKRKLEGELFILMNQGSVFELSEKEKKEKSKRADSLHKEIEKLTAEIEEIKANKIFENAFEWRFEFPEVLNDDGDFVGFDVVIGNPPYIRQEEIKHQKKYFQTNYATYHSMADLYVFFIEKSVQISASNGILSLITNNKWLLAGYGEPLRAYLLKKRLLEIINFGDRQVFADATTYPSILTFQNQEVNTVEQRKASEAIIDEMQDFAIHFNIIKEISDLPDWIKQGLVLNQSIEDIDIFTDNLSQLLNYKKELNGLFAQMQKMLKRIQMMRLQLAEKIEFRLTVLDNQDFESLNEYVEANSHLVIQNNLNPQPWMIGRNDANTLLMKIASQYPKLEEYIGEMGKYGIKTGLTEAFVIDKEMAESMIQQNPVNKQHLYPFLLGRNIKPYTAGIPENYLIKFDKGFTKNNISENHEKWMADKFPELFNHLITYQEKAAQRTDKGDFWWELRACDYYDKFTKPKIMYQVLQVKPCFIYDEEGLFCNNSMWFIPSDNKVLLGILNSKMGWWLISKYCTAIQNGYQLIWRYFSQIPIATGNDTISAQITHLVDEVLKYKKVYPITDTTDLENQIDQLVYELYGLTEEEIRIVEGR